MNHIAFFLNWKTVSYAYKKSVQFKLSNWELIKQCDLSSIKMSDVAMMINNDR